VRNPYELWERKHAINEANIKAMYHQFLEDKPLTGGFDTETTGLHIVKDKPFLIQFGWLVPKQDYGRVFTFYPTKESYEMFFCWLRN
jgi:hypothetical protein